ncbi:hypothetical protein EDD36DRAFT_436213 [Exophiala viscosa]|uniref:DNA damage-responsive protein 48 n=1 Tax=Exophiala viscosa TaxID=2486360 RepID=A0AAN6E009_9EURO|nr:hypothetical protein EDD36DRAFT_436213 [Exophiala viscosa]
MDQLRGAINSFAGGNNNQQNPQHGGQTTSSGGGNVLGGTDNGQYPQQTGQGTFGGSMDNNGRTAQQTGQGTSGGGGGGGGNFLGGLGNKLNAAAGGGPTSEKNEDMLDKGIDYVQEKFLGQGPQNNESAAEQMKDEQISDFIRSKYKSTTGSDFPIQDKSR